ncbi:MAG: capsule assembly Wzi family protein [Treponema sp.]|jgi:hypothetical protein|nr:capsule assembly Wzi family protein [Treponema sp.]
MKSIRLILVVFLLFFSAFFLFSSPYDMIPVGDPILEDLIYLSLESGNPILSFTPPFPPHEIENFLESLDISALSVPAQEAYYRIKRRLNPEAPVSLSSGIFLFTLNLSSTIEIRTRFNTDISWYPQYPKIPSLLSLPLRFYFTDYVQLYFEPIIAIDPEYYGFGNSGSFGLNIPTGLHKLDQNLPLRAYLAAGASWWNFQIGRDRLSYGTGQMGNLTVSDNPSFYEFARLSFFSKFFKYSLLVSQMPLQIKDKYGELLVGNNINLTDESLMYTTQRYLYMHRLEFSLFNTLSISLTEGVLVGNSAFELRYLNPLVVFHSLYSWWNYTEWRYGEDTDENRKYGHMTGSLFSLEVNWNIMKSLAVYGQLVMNQFATFYKKANYGDQPPNGMGYIAGARFSHSFDTWASVFSLEFIYTDPYLYMNPSPFASFIHMRYLGASPDRLLYSFIGYPRDIITVTLGTKFFNADFLAISGNFTWLAQGKHTIKWDWEQTGTAYNERTPSGSAKHSLIASLGVQWKPYNWLVLSGNITGIFPLGNNSSNKPGGQASVKVSFLY